MQFKHISVIAIISLAFSSVSAMAQVSGPRVVVGTDSGVVGSAAPVVIPVEYFGDGTVVGLEFEIAYDSSNLTADLSACGGPLGGATVQCSGAVPGIIKFLAFDQTFTPLPGGSMGSVSFDISSAPINDYPLVVQNELYGDAQEGNVPSAGSTNGAVQVVEGPQPIFQSTPDAGSTINFGNQIGLVANTGVLIENIGLAETSMVGNCSLTNDIGGKLSFVSGGGDYTLAGGASDSLTIGCDTSVVGDFNGGELTCTHNGGVGSEELTGTATWTLNCSVSEGPQPNLGASPASFAFDITEEGDPDQSGTLTITNTGDVDSELTGACTFSGDSAITFSGADYTALAKDASVDYSVGCSGANEGDFSGDITCTGDPEGQVTIPVTCKVGPPGPAVYSSTPAPGATIAMTPAGEDVLVGSDDPTSQLQITNAAAELNDRDLALSDCAFAGSAEITATPVVSPLAPNLSTIVTFTCDTAATGAFTGTYSCSYDENGDDQADGTATYIVNCGVRDPESDVSESPASGTSLTIVVPIGGSGTVSVRFNELLGEGANGILDNCSLDDETYFSIVSDPVYPQDIPADGYLDVTIEGTDPGDSQLEASTVLTCSYSDSNDDLTEVSWPISLLVQTVAIPTLSTWGLIVMFLTLLGLGGLAFRRRLPN